jgi:chromosomal replication initiator protein
MPKSALNPRYTFDDFVVSDSNRDAHTAATAMVSNPSVLQNPLFIFGGVATGKTHLLHAIGNAVKPRGLRVFYRTCEQFTAAIIRAYSTNRAEQFRTGLEDIDVLLLDDIDFLAGRERTQQVFLYIFKTLSRLSRQVVVSSNCQPAVLEGMDKNLIRWFEHGRLTCINVADKTLTAEVLQRRKRKCGIELRDDVAALLTSGCTTVRKLDGKLTRLRAECTLMHEKPNLTTVRRVLRSQ